MKKESAVSTRGFVSIIIERLRRKGRIDIKFKNEDEDENEKEKEKEREKKKKGVEFIKEKEVEKQRQRQTQAQILRTGKKMHECMTQIPQGSEPCILSS